MGWNLPHRLGWLLVHRNPLASASVALGLIHLPPYLAIISFRGLYKNHTFLNHCSVEGHLDFLHLLAVANNAAMTMLFGRPRVVILQPLQPRNGTTGSHGGPVFNFIFSFMFRFYFCVGAGEVIYMSPCIVKVKDHFWGYGFCLSRTSIVFPIMTAHLHFQHHCVRALFPAHPQQYHSLTTARIVLLIFSGWL